MVEFLTVFGIGIGLAMDAFSVAVCKGLGMPRINRKQMLIIGLLFGGFQALMPLIGWLLGSSFSQYVSFLAPWISFILLSFIGGKMIWEAIRGGDECEQCQPPFSLTELLSLAVATSIDALVMGVSFSLDGTNIWLAISVIGVTTLLLSIAGVLIGHKFGNKFQKKAEIAGGVILCLIGIKALLEYLL
ncbi:MAG: manganese efflux pump [Clostridia bacterium]|nr:manganese efflux pump [Clostridia bacterium]MBQ2940160.1 manganese efflux pump [Clostridia bacterium]